MPLCQVCKFFALEYLYGVLVTNHEFWAMENGNVDITEIWYGRTILQKRWTILICSNIHIKIVHFLVKIVSPSASICPL